MLITLSGQQFKRVLDEKRRVSDANFLRFSAVAGAISEHWLTRLEPQKVLILMFILGRTLFYRKEAEQIWTRHFLNGIKQQDGTTVCVGVGMSENTYRRHLSELIEEDFVNAYRNVSDKGSESEARIFEINFKKIVGDDDQIEDRNMLPIPKKPRQNGHNQSHEGDSNGREGGLPNAGRHNYTYINQRLDKSNLSPASGEPEARKVLAIPKRSRAVVEQVAQDASQVVATILQAHAAQRVSRTKAAAAKSPWLLSQREMQAVVDQQMADNLPSEPRLIVTGKDFGFFRKRLKESAPKDFSHFIGWCFRYWHTVATQNRKAVNRKVMNGDTNSRPGSLMPLTPDFTSLVLRYPYFLKAYQNFLAERRETVEQDQQQKEVRRLEQVVRRVEQEKATLQRRLRERPRIESEAAPAEVRATRVSRSSGKAEDDELPAWEEFNSKEQRHARH